MAITLPHIFKPKETAASTAVNENFAAVVSALEGVSAAAVGTDLYQAGVVSAGDWTVEAPTCNAGTGNLTYLLVGGSAWLPGPTSGLVRTFTPLGPFGPLVPPVKPAPGGFVKIGVELTASGSEAVLSVVSGAEKVTEAEAIPTNAGPAITAGKIRLFDFILKNVAGVFSVTEARDRRRYAGGLERSINAGEETRSSASYGVLNFPDEVEVTLPTNGVIMVLYHAEWKSSEKEQGRAAIFCGAAQLKVGGKTSAAPTNLAANTYGHLLSSSAGLIAPKASLAAAVTTGEALGAISTGSEGEAGIEISGGAFFKTFTPSGACYIVAAPGTYTLSVRFKALGGTVTAQNRKLWAKAL